MSNNKTTNVYDDGNIPEIDLPGGKSKNCTKNACMKKSADKNMDKNANKNTSSAEKLPEAFRPRKDGPGGE